MLMLQLNVLLEFRLWYSSIRVSQSCALKNTSDPCVLLQE